MEDVLKKYDKQLSCKRKLDGTIIVFRKSPFSATIEHDIFKIQNQYVGSAKWVRKKLIEMDTTRNDIVGDVLRHNKNIRESKEGRGAHEEIADFMLSGGSIIIN